MNKGKHTSSFSIALQPYLGLITDGIEQWSRKVKPINIYISKFTDEENSYYTEMRNSIKMWNNDFHTLNQTLCTIYNENDTSFSNLCKPIAKKLNFI